MQKIKVLWFRQDFRLENNPAYYEISNSKEKFIAIYAFDQKKFNERSAQRWWLYKTLQNIEKKLSDKGVIFKIFACDITEAIQHVIKDKSIETIYWNELNEPSEIKKDLILENYLNENGIKYKKFKGNLLQDPFIVKKKDGTPFQVFTPYWKNAEEQYLRNNNYVNKVSNFKNTPLKNNNNEILDKFIKPRKNWYVKFEKYWKVGEENAKILLKDFISKKISNYATNRDIPSSDGTSKLSPYLAFGEISVQTLFDECYKISKKNIGFRKFINEIGWREFSHHLINHFPKMESGNLRKQFDKFKWVKDSDKLTKWKKGQTGYPIVDAGMRELRETGWMHNRVRMITASFLVKHLRINWIEGEKYFRDSLLDFNTANNVAGWQWVAGCGADAAPYFRIFNPILQGEKFDPEGIYVKKWIKELSMLPKKFIHKPWELPSDLCNQYDFDLARDYTKPIVKHEEARKLALNAFSELKN